MIEQKTIESIEELKHHVVCPVELALRILGGKWRGSILYQLRDESLRFNELKARVQDAVVEPLHADNYLTNKVLSHHLKKLMDYQLVQKTGDEENAARYALTPKGNSVMPILIDLFYWGENEF